LKAQISFQKKDRLSIGDRVEDVTVDVVENVTVDVVEDVCQLRFHDGASYRLRL
jgi:hypothetical protein